MVWRKMDNHTVSGTKYMVHVPYLVHKNVRMIFFKAVIGANWKSIVMIIMIMNVRTKFKVLNCRDCKLQGLRFFIEDPPMAKKMAKEWNVVVTTHTTVTVTYWNFYWRRIHVQEAKVKVVRILNEDPWFLCKSIIIVLTKRQSNQQ